MSGKIIATSMDPLTSAESLELSVDESRVRKKWDRLERFLTAPHVDMMKKVGRLYEFVDWFMDSSGVNRASVCKKGCNHCCYVDVDVSLIEAAYIAKNTQYHQVMRSNRVQSGYHKQREYCGFVDQVTGACTIYDVRPLACRTFVAFDNPELCDADNGTKPHAIFRSESHSLLNHVKEQLWLTSGQQFADIREWFIETTPVDYEDVISKDVTFQLVP